MDVLKRGSGDNNNALPISSTYADVQVTNDGNEVTVDREKNEINSQEAVTPRIIDDTEMKLKDRVAQCRNIIESLKFELHAEKSKLEMESKTSQFHPAITEAPSTYTSGHQDISTTDDRIADLSYTPNMYSACVDSKLNCDENLMEYEKQLQKYQNTLNMAQIEKKNAIRKQMLSKAYRLKLLEVENQCNIELLRVKQSLQCLEPLRMIANKWKTNNDEPNYDLSNFERMPRYPELGTYSAIDVDGFKEDSDAQIAAEKTEKCSKK